MNGRDENKLKIEETLIEWMKNRPRYYKRYYDSLISKTPTTKRKYIHDLDRFIKFIKDEYEFDVSKLNWTKQVKPSMLNSFIASINSKDSYKASIFYSVKCFFRWLMMDDYINYNPCDRVEAPQDKDLHEITYLTKEEIEIVKNNILYGIEGNENNKKRMKYKDRDVLIFLLMLYTGMRITSVMEINLSDINDCERKIKITEKGGNSRYISYPEILDRFIFKYESLRSYILNEKDKNCDAFFINSRGSRMSTQNFAELLSEYTSTLNKKITPHKLRSTCATSLYEATGDIYLTMHVLGHKNINNTRRYAEVSRNKEEEALKALNDFYAI